MNIRPSIAITLIAATVLALTFAIYTWYTHTPESQLDEDSPIDALGIFEPFRDPEPGDFVHPFE